MGWFSKYSPFWMNSEWNLSKSFRKNPCIFFSSYQQTYLTSVFFCGLLKQNITWAAGYRENYFTCPNSFDFRLPFSPTVQPVTKKSPPWRNAGDLPPDTSEVFGGGFNKWEVEGREFMWEVGEATKTWITWYIYIYICIYTSLYTYTYTYTYKIIYIYWWIQHIWNLLWLVIDKWNCM